MELGLVSALNIGVELPVKVPRLIYNAFLTLLSGIDPLSIVDHHDIWAFLQVVFTLLQSLIQTGLRIIVSRALAAVVSL